jgi:hypothetical protein
VGIMLISTPSRRHRHRPGHRHRPSTELPLGSSVCRTSQRPATSLHPQPTAHSTQHTAHSTQHTAHSTRCISHTGTWRSAARSPWQVPLLCANLLVVYLKPHYRLCNVALVFVLYAHDSHLTMALVWPLWWEKKSGPRSASQWPWPCAGLCARLRHIKRAIYGTCGLD